MITAVDVYYKDSATATAGAVIFSSFTDTIARSTYTLILPGAVDYIPGQFFRRELPCIMKILKVISEEIDTVVIDGYVNLGRNPGLGMHLWKTLDGKKIIIGVAKRHFIESDAIEVFRGTSRRPLYVTAAGIEPAIAADLIAKMYGKYRIPELLKQADSLSRSI